MVSGTSTTEDVVQVEARRLWNATTKDSHNFLPKVLPEVFTSVTLLQGDGGVGTVKHIIFTPGKRDYSFIKERVDELDEQNFVYKYSVIEGGPLGNKLSSACFVVKLVPRKEGGCVASWKEGGCVASWTCNYETLPGVQPDEGKMKELKEDSLVMLRKVEKYLLSNPNLYC